MYIYNYIYILSINAGFSIAMIVFLEGSHVVEPF